MKINNIKECTPAFSGALNNKAVLKGLEKISDHGASFVAGVSLCSAAFLRPAVISHTPNTDKENKRLASANSVASAISKFVIAESVALPIENAVKKIDTNPSDYLKNATINTLKTKGKNLNQSKNYRFATQLIKLGSGILSAVPKSVLTIALVPVIADNLFAKKDDIQKKDAEKENKYAKMQIENPVFYSFTSNAPSFKGSPVEKIAKGIGGILDNEKVLNFVKKNSVNDTNIARNISNTTDVLLTATAVLQTKKSKKIEEENKNPLVYNNIISTAFSILFGSMTDEFIKRGTKNSIDKFAAKNVNNPKLSKYIDGINILRPTIIFALVYYGILPFISTYFADKIDKINKKSAGKN